MNVRVVMAGALAAGLAVLAGCGAGVNRAQDRSYNIGVVTYVPGIADIPVSFLERYTGDTGNYILSSRGWQDDFETLSEAAKRYDNMWEIVVTQLPDHYLCAGINNSGVVKENVRMRVACQRPEVSTFAGSSQGASGYVNNASGEAARFNAPAAMAINSATGTIYVADTNNDKIRAITATGQVSDFASVTAPRAVAVDPFGQVYVVTATTLMKFKSDGTLLNGTLATDLTSPGGLALDSMGDIYVSDPDAHVIWKISGNTKTVYAGQIGQDGQLDAASGTGARFAMPNGLAFDRYDNLYVADTFNSVIRKIAAKSGAVTTLSGPTDEVNDRYGLVSGQSRNVRFNYPLALTVDPKGNVWVADTTNNAVRLVTTTGGGSTIAGLGSGTFGLVNGVPGVARFNNPSGIVIDASGNLFIADTRNNAIRKVTFVSPS